MKAITTRYVGATDRKPARIIASDLDGNRITRPADGANFPYDDAHRAAAVALCAKMDWPGGESLIGGAVKQGMVWVFPPILQPPGADDTLPSLGAKDSACREYGHRWTEDGAYCRSCGRVNAR